MAGFTSSDVDNQKGRTFLITGSNTGLGFETARVLAARDGNIILACRSKDKAEAAMAEIRAETRKAKLGFIALDLSDLAAVRTAAKEVLAGPKIDVLINNAGVMIPPRTLTAQGVELQFGVNHLGTFAFTGLIHRHVSDRIILTASLAHKGGRIDLTDLGAERGYYRWPRYQMSKLANLMHMFELDRRLKAAGRTTMTMGCHPGGAMTELARHLPAALRWAMQVSRPFFNSAAEGAWPTLQAATWDGAKGGDYFGPQGLGEMSGRSGYATTTRTARDPERAAMLWEKSIELTGVDPGL